MRRGQTELPFQWIFVLLAGAAFLAIFFFLIRGCTNAGDARIQGTGVSYAASRIVASAWQANTNLTMSIQSADVVCPTGVIILLSGSSTASVDMVPAFLPASVGGLMTLQTKDFALSGDAPISFGNVLYAIADNQYYVIVDDHTGGKAAAMKRTLGDRSNVIIVSDENSIDTVTIPDTALGVVIVKFTDPAPIKSPQAGAKPMAAVTFNQAQKIVKFWKYSGATPTFVKQEYYVGDLLMAGAIVSGNDEDYLCAKQQLISRMRTILVIAQKRAQRISNDAAVSDACKAIIAKELGLGGALYAPATNSDDNILNVATSTLANDQQALYRGGCPVIA